MTLLTLLACADPTATLTLRFAAEPKFEPVCEGLRFEVDGQELPASADGDCAWTVQGLPLGADVSLSVSGRGYDRLKIEIPAAALGDDAMARRMIEDPRHQLALDPFSGWDLAARRAAWNGVWLIEAGGLGAWEVWQVTDEGVEAWRGDERVERTLELISPCAMNVGGYNGGYVGTYTIEGDRLITGLGDAGGRLGGQVVVCAVGKHFDLEGEDCRQWRRSFGRWESEPSSCRIERDGDQEVFVYEAFGTTTKIPIVDDVIANKQIRSGAERFPTVEAAQEARAKKVW